MAEKNTANIGFEKQIWDAACVLRGNMDASEYKNVVLELAVFENNESARRCYEAAGFTEYAESEYKMPIGTWNCTEMELHCI